MRHFKLLLTSIAFTVASVCVNAQVLNTDTRQQLFDYDWKFFQGDDPEASSINFKDNAWRKLDLPHDWSIEGEFNASNPMGNDGGYLPAGIGWYRKTFSVPNALKTKRVSIYFGGVYMSSEVFINGKSLGVYPYGYSSFNYDLTPYLNYGKENVISVRVDNAKQKNSRWYSGSGIYRHVWLTITDDIHVSHLGTAITTPKVSANEATVQVITRIKNDTGKPQSVRIKTVLFSAGHKSAGNCYVDTDLLPNGEKEVRQVIKIPKPRLWMLESPNLYTCQTQIIKDNNIVDHVSDEFGIRTIEFSPQNGFRLNGKTLKINGGCVHHDNGCLGAAAYDRAEVRKVELLKVAGFNTVRTSHNPPSEAFLDACDRLGLLVIDEAFDGWRTKKTTMIMLCILISGGKRILRRW